MDSVVSTMEVFFSGLLAYWYDQAEDRLQVGIPYGAHDHSLSIKALIKSRAGIEPINLGTPRDKTEIHLRTEPEMPLKGRPFLGPMLQLDGWDFHDRKLEYVAGSLTPSLFVYSGVFSPATIIPVRVVSPPPSEMAVPPKKKRWSKKTTPALPSAAVVDREQNATLLLKDMIYLRREEVAVLRTGGGEEWRFPAHDDVNYVLLISNLPPFFHSHHGPASHFQFFYDIAFPSVPLEERFDIQPSRRFPDPAGPVLHLAGKVDYKYPCLGVELGQTSIA